MFFLSCTQIINNFAVEEALLISKIVAGDTNAEGQLILKFRERIEFLVRVKLKGKVSQFDRDDIISDIQNAVLTSIRKNGFDQSKGKPLEAYIAGVASNVIAMHFRKLKTTKPAEDINKYQNLNDDNNPLTLILNEEKKNEIQLCLNKLQPKYKEILLLRIHEELSIEEISDQLNLEKRRVSERINYALKLLLKELKKRNYFQYSSAYSK